MSISLCLITKEEDIEHAKECVDSVSDYVGEVCVTVTYTDEKPDLDLPDDWKVSYYQWHDDFASARTYNFSQATGDWILWLDADDILEGGEHLETLIKQAEKKHIAAYFFPYYYLIDSQGNPLEIHQKIQFLRNDGSFRWEGWVHETLISEYPQTIIKATEFADVKRIHKYGMDESQEKTQRNLRIMQKQLEAQGDNPDPRTLFLISRPLMRLGQLDEAAAMLDKYLELSGWEEEVFEAHLLLSEIYRQREQWDAALEHINNAMLIRPEYPDAYFEMARIYTKLEDYYRALAYLDNGFSKKIDPDRHRVNWAELTWRPLVLYSWCCLQVGRIDEAKQYIDKAMELGAIEDKYTKAIKDPIDKAKEKNDAAKGYLKAVKYIQQEEEEWKVKPLLASIPASMSDDPRILSIKFAYQPPKEWQSDEIAIYCPRSVEPWTPDNLREGGIGGSETAVIHLAREWAKMGWKVTVYNWCSTGEGEYDGVTYTNYWNLNHQDKFNILISWRFPELADYDIDANFFAIDMHDVSTPNIFTAKRLEKIDKVFVKTQAHRDCFPTVPDEKITIVNNGIDPDRFGNDVDKNPYRLVYSSTVDRGLERLLELFPKIKEQVPEAELHLYYGIKTYYELEKENPERMKLLKKVERLIDETDGVINHGRVDQYRLAEDFEKSAILAYPTDFFEISWIGGIEAQMAQCLPVTTTVGAIPETVQHGVFVDKDIHLEEAQEEWVQKVVHYLKNPEEREKLMKDAPQYVKENLTWNQSAKKLSAVMSNAVKGADSKQQNTKNTTQAESTPAKETI